MEATDQCGLSSAVAWFCCMPEFCEVLALASAWQRLHLPDYTTPSSSCVCILAAVGNCSKDGGGIGSPAAVFSESAVNSSNGQQHHMVISSS